MVKYVGMAFLFFACVGTGIYFSQRLYKRTETIFLMKRLLLQLINNLSYQKTPTLQMLKQLSTDQSYQKLPFLAKMKPFFSESVPTSEIWNLALEQTESAMSVEEKELLRETGKILGSCNSETQIKELELQQKKLEMILEEALKNQETHGKLFRSMGILAGFLLVILSI